MQQQDAEPNGYLSYIEESENSNSLEYCVWMGEHLKGKLRAPQGACKYLSH